MLHRHYNIKNINLTGNRNISKSLAYTYKEKIDRGNFNMEYAKDEVFQVKYSTGLNRLKGKDETWTSRLASSIKKHKWITTIMIALLMFATINLIMIGNFIKILQNV